MTTNPTSFAASQVIGVVESVSPSEVTVRLTTDSPQATALNAGHLQRFPRINGWLLIPSEAGYMVGSVTWIGAERDPLPTGLRRAQEDILDLPFPARRLKLNPLGTLRWTTRNGQQHAELTRGIASYPSVGEPTLVPSAEQLRVIAQSTSPHAHVRIGTSPLAGDVEVRVDPDRLFGRHLAVLGNTGSGKSCTVAGLIRWSLQAAWEAMPGDTDTNSPQSPSSAPNARFIVLDPNGEYGTCFSDVAGVRVFRPTVEHEEIQQLTVPGWVWSSAEWAAISRASLQTQRPLLQQALRNLRNNIDVDGSSLAWLVQQARGFLGLFQGYAADPAKYLVFPASKNVDGALESTLQILEMAQVHGHGQVVATALTRVQAVGRRYLGIKYPPPLPGTRHHRGCQCLDRTL